MVYRLDTVCNVGDGLDENNNKQAIQAYENALKRMTE